MVLDAGYCLASLVFCFRWLNQLPKMLEAHGSCMLAGWLTSEGSFGSSTSRQCYLDRCTWNADF